MLKKDELYNKSLKQFISILANIKLQVKQNPEKAEEHISEVIALLRSRIVVPEVGGDFKKSSKFLVTEKRNGVCMHKKSSGISSEVSEQSGEKFEDFVSADKIKESEGA